MQIAKTNIISFYNQNLELFHKIIDGRSSSRGDFVCKDNFVNLFVFIIKRLF